MITSWINSLFQKLRTWIKKDRKNAATSTLLVILLFIPFALAFTTLLSRPVEAAWFDNSFAFRKKLSIANSGSSTQTDFQTQVTIDTSTLIGASKMQSNCNDMRFTDLSGKSLSYWIEPNTCNTASTLVWVKISIIPTTGADIYFYYGNSGASSLSATTPTFIQDVAQAAATWPLDDSVGQSYSRVANPALATGRNIVVDPGLDDASKWTVGTGWVVSGSVATATSAAVGQRLTANFVTDLIPGRAYSITYTATVTGGSIRLQVGVTGNGTTRSSSGTYTETVIDGTDATLRFDPTLTAFTGTIDNVSVTEVNIPASSATPTQLLVDGDMEAGTTAAWTASTATLSKQSGTRPGGTGTKVLRVAADGVHANPFAYQIILTIGQTYRVTGYARSDGTGVPRIVDNTGVVSWIGTVSTAWQPIDGIFVAKSTILDLYVVAGAGSANYAEFDDVTVSVDNYIRTGNVIVNGTFDADDGTWTKGTNATISGGKLNITAGSSSVTTQVSAVVIGKTYQISYTISNYTGGNLLMEVGTTGTSRNANGTFNDTLLATSSTFTIFGNSTFAASVDDVTVVEVPPMVGLPLNGVTLGASSGAGGHLTNAYNFDGTNDVANIYSGSLNSTFNQNEGTVVAWAKVSGAGVWTDNTNRAIVWLESSTSTNRIRLQRATTSNVLSFYYEVGGVASNVNFTTAAPTGWFQIAITWSKATDQMKAYLNGVQVGSTQTGLGTWTGNLASTGATIGAATSSGGTPWSGMINDVHLYSRPLSAAEISAEYNASYDTQNYTTTNYLNHELTRKFSSGVTQGSFAAEEIGTASSVYYKFNEGDGSIANDSSTNLNNGTLGGTTKPTWQTEDQCISGKCLLFNGLTSKVTGSKIVTSVNSISFWIKPINNTSQGILNFDGGTHKLTTDVNGVLTATGFTSPIYYLNGQLVTTLTLIQGSWNHVEITTATPFSTTSSFTIGTDGTTFTSGYIDELRMYPAVRTLSQVQSDFNLFAEKLGSPAVVSTLNNNLVANWPLDEALNTSNASVTGTATAGAASTLTDSGATWVVNGFNGFQILITSGTGSGQTRTVASNTATVITVSNNWTVNPDNTSHYTIILNVSNSRAITPVTNLTRNVVVNGGFDVDANWAEPAGATISGGLAHFNNVALGLNMPQVLPVTLGRYYKVTFTILNYVSGTAQCRFLSGGGGTAVVSGNGTYTGVGVALSTSIAVIASTNATMDFDNVIVQEVDVPASNTTPTQLLNPGVWNNVNASAWTAGDSATITMQNATLHDGTSGTVLRVARSTVSTPYAQQTPLTVGNLYRVYGYARSDGNASIRVFNNIVTPIVSLPPHTDWQPFDTNFVAAGTDIDFGSTTNTGTQYAEFEYSIVAIDNFISPSTNILTGLDGNMEVAPLTGTATAGASTTLTDGGQTWAVNQFANQIVSIVGGTGANQSRIISSNTATVLTVPAWTVNPDNTSQYQIISNWTIGQTAALSKQTGTPHSGTYSLRIARSGTNNAEAVKSGLVTGKTYKITGYFRGDGTNGGGFFNGGVVINGTSSNTWQYLEATFVASQPGYTFRSTATLDGGYIEIDDITITEVSPEVGKPTNGVIIGQTANGHLNNAYSFDGVNDVENLYSNQLNSTLNGNEGTFNIWFKVANAGVWTDGSLRFIAAIFNGNSQNQILIDKQTTSNNLALTFRANNIPQSISLTNFSPTSWQMATITWSKSADQVRFFINGVQQGLAQTGVGDWTANVSPNLSASGAIIGAQATTGTSPWSGFLNDTSIYNRALSQSEIVAMYGTAPGPVGYWNLDEGTAGTSFDRSGNGYDGTDTGTSVVAGQFGKGRSFNGTSDKTTVSATIPTVQTYEFWVNPTSTTQTIAGLTSGAYVSASAGTLSATGFTSPIIYVNGISGGALTANVWQHVAVTTTTPITSANAVTFGFANATFYSGKLDDIKIYSYPRSQAQILEDMGTNPPPSNTNGRLPTPVGWWKFDEGYGTTNAAHNAGSGGSALNGTLTNMASPATSTSGWQPASSGLCKINGCIAFDGSNDQVNTAVSGLPNPSSDSYTISAWIYPTNIPGAANPRIFSYATDANNGFSFVFGGANCSGRIVFSAHKAGTLYEAGCTATALSTNHWYYVTGVFNSTTNTSTVYLNGQQNQAGTGAGFGIPSSFTNAFIGSNNASGSYFQGNIDNVRVYNTALSAQQVMLDMNAGASENFGVTANTEASLLTDTAGAAPVAYWNFEEGSGTSANDVSGNGNTGTWQGTLGKQWASGKIGTAGNFNGTDNNIDLGTPSDLTITYGNAYTLCGWFNLSSTASQYLIAPQYVKLALAVDTSKFALSSYTTGGAYEIARASTFNTNTWYYVCGILQTNGTKLIYVNGISQALSGATTASSINTTSGWRGAIGSRGATGVGLYTQGQIDDVKIYNYARTPAQVAYDYNRGAPIGWWKFDECQGTTANDSTGNGNTGTITIGGTGTQNLAGTCNTASTAWGNGATGKFNSSLNFDGTDDEVDIPNTSSIQVGGKDLTLSMWINPSSLTNTCDAILDKGTSAATREYSIFLKCTLANQVWVALGNATGAAITTSSNFVTGAWQHLVVTRVGSNVTLYRNGVSVGTGTQSSTSTNSTQLVIGKSTSTGGNNFAGQVDDVRIYNYALSASQVQQVYNNGAVTFGPATGSP